MFYKKDQGNLKQNLGIHGHETRNKCDLHTCYFSTVLYQRSMTNMGIKLFKKLPVQIKQFYNYNGVKRELKKFLFNNSFYTIEEYFAP